MSGELIAVLVAIGILFVIFLIFSFLRWNANRITRWFSLKKLEINKPIEEYTKLLLEENNLIDVEVKRVGFFATLFVGNTYKCKTKTIRLGWLTWKRTTKTSLAMACKLVGLAKLHSEGIKGVKFVNLNRWLSGLPILLLPLTIIGLIVDLIATGNIGMYTLIFAGIGLALTLISFIISIVSVKTENKALKIGQDIILDLGILNEEEEKKIKKLFKAWKTLYIINAIFNAFQIVYYTLAIILSILKLGVKR